MEKAILILLATTATVLSNPVMTRQDLVIQANKTKVCSNLIHLNNLYYLPGESKTINGFPSELSVHWKTGNIFYILTIGEANKSIQLLRPSGEAESIKVEGSGQSTTVDNLNDIVYLATDKGVYKYKDDGSTEPFAAIGEDVTYIAASNDGMVYIATWPQNRVHKITNDGQIQETLSAIPDGQGLTVDMNNNIFFARIKSVHVLQNGQSEPIKIKKRIDRLMTVSVSRSGEVFAMDVDSNLYKIDTENASARRLGSFNVTAVNTFAMDSADNILIGVNKNILKFNVHEHNPCIDYENRIKLVKGTADDDESKNELLQLLRQSQTRNMKIQKNKLLEFIN